MCKDYGFAEECLKTINPHIFYLFAEIFKCMPVAAIVEEKMFCVHGGLSPSLQHMDQIREIPRPAEVVQRGLLCDLLWSDPDPTIMTWRKNFNRNTSYVYGSAVVGDFLKRHDFDLICRAHEAVPAGFQFFAGLQLVTIFSSTNYNTNNAVFMRVDDQLHCTFHSIEMK